MTMLPVIPALVISVLAGFRVAQAYQRSVVFRLGRYRRLKGPGLYWTIPLIDWQRKVDRHSATVSIEQQETIPKASVTAKVSAVLWYKIVDPERAVIG